ncbi:conserved hypothetical protein [Burkholderia pseudomallei 406e]|uniref:Uncharacterized protein n=2 Tax=Burkholderia pseudomallei TaxID=28450 RepID=A0A0E1VZZ1_BURPE|nr:hypothetical protein BURPS1106A_2049 [Burkholderia pseudomallei 1106a]AFR15966.1 hypothetical protein BPC006_I2096 [Burkholderia pseudomallei BPC006]EDO84799.1 conserved hypothetical protein [Burkholderia pseudomallei 406e]EDO92224.1 hypothetical protein BURPSPAST_AA0713 [Burkholderia pseudomallei Pasteur 52237]EDS86624.1 hypothetical protein BURPSS13_P0671 [Burkholderia pseudomallei S13]EEC35644.1 conserved hypothetical protein [Burkholderia pseudomallei 576]EEH26592.1 conserved hypotheti
MDDRADTLSAIAQAINDALTVDGSRRCRRPALRIEWLGVQIESYGERRRAGA